MVIFETQRGPDYAPNAGQHVRDHVDVGLILRYPDVVVSVEEGHKTVPDGEDAKDIVKNSCDVDHQVRRDQPERDNDGQLGRVVRVTRCRKISHQPNEE